MNNISSRVDDTFLCTKNECIINNSRVSYQLRQSSEYGHIKQNRLRKLKFSVVEYRLLMILIDLHNPLTLARFDVVKKPNLHAYKHQSIFWHKS